jgi:Eukaryotic protein of unknown function (DUF846)
MPPVPFNVNVTVIWRKETEVYFWPFYRTGWKREDLYYAFCMDLCDISIGFKQTSNDNFHLHFGNYACISLLFVQAGAWVLLGIFSLIRFQADYVLVIGVCLTLNVANIIGFTKCRKGTLPVFMSDLSGTVLNGNFL